MEEKIRDKKEINRILRNFCNRKFSKLNYRAVFKSGFLKIYDPYYFSIPMSDVRWVENDDFEITIFTHAYAISIRKNFVETHFSGFEFSRKLTDEYRETLVK